MASMLRCGVSLEGRLFGMTVLLFCWDFWFSSVTVVAEHQDGSFNDVQVNHLCDHAHVANFATRNGSNIKSKSQCFRSHAVQAWHNGDWQRCLAILSAGKTWLDSELLSARPPEDHPSHDDLSKDLQDLPVLPVDSDTQTRKLPPALQTQRQHSAIKAARKAFMRTLHFLIRRFVGHKCFVLETVVPPSRDGSSTSESSKLSPAKSTSAESVCGSNLKSAVSPLAGATIYRFYRNENCLTALGGEALRAKQLRLALKYFVFARLRSESQCLRARRSRSIAALTQLIHYVENNQPLPEMELSAIDVRSAAELTLHEFVIEYVRTQRPVVITGLVELMGISHWTLDTFVKTCPDWMVDPAFIGSKYSHKWGGLDRHRSLSLKQFVEMLPTALNKGYIHDASIASGSCKSLLDTFRVPKYFANDLNFRLPLVHSDSEAYLFAGPRYALPDKGQPRPLNDAERRHRAAERTRMHDSSGLASGAHAHAQRAVTDTMLSHAPSPASADSGSDVISGSQSNARTGTNTASDSELETAACPGSVGDGDDRNDIDVDCEAYIQSLRRFEVRVFKSRRGSGRWLRNGVLVHDSDTSGTSCLRTSATNSTAAHCDANGTLPLTTLTGPPAWPSIFIGGAGGTRSKLHVDSKATQFWMALLQGEKRWTIFPPSEAPLLGVINDNIVYQRYRADAISPDYNDLPLMRLAKGYRHVLEPGQVIYIPGGAIHQVENAPGQVSIAVAGNFIDPNSLNDTVHDTAHMVANDWRRHPNVAIDSVQGWLLQSGNLNETVVDYDTADEVTVPWYRYHGDALRENSVQWQKKVPDLSQRIKAFLKAHYNLFQRFPDIRTLWRDSDRQGHGWNGVDSKRPSFQKHRWDQERIPKRVIREVYKLWRKHSRNRRRRRRRRLSSARRRHFQVHFAPSRN